MSDEAAHVESLAAATKTFVAKLVERAGSAERAYNVAATKVTEEDAAAQAKVEGETEQRKSVFEDAMQQAQQKRAEADEAHREARQRDAQEVAVRRQSVSTTGMQRSDSFRARMIAQADEEQHQRAAAEQETKSAVAAAAVAAEEDRDAELERHRQVAEQAVAVLDRNEFHQTHAHLSVPLRAVARDDDMHDMVRLHREPPVGGSAAILVAAAPLPAPATGNAAVTTDTAEAMHDAQREVAQAINTDKELTRTLGRRPKRAQDANDGIEMMLDKLSMRE